MDEVTTLVDLTCRRCGKHFQRRPKRMRSGKRGHYCSKACRDHRVERTCEACGASFSVKPYALTERPVRFCSKACQRKGMATRVHACEGCGQPFTRTGHPNTARFCSHECYARWLAASGAMAGEKHPGWMGGLSWSNRLRGPNWSVQRRAALKRDGNRCTKCGATRASGARLVVHHIVAFREYGMARYEEANRLDNLTTLCDPCHTTLEWQVRQGGRLF